MYLLLATDKLFLRTKVYSHYSVSVTKQVINQSLIASFLIIDISCPDPLNVLVLHAPFPCVHNIETLSVYYNI